MNEPKDQFDHGQEIKFEQAVTNDENKSINVEVCLTHENKEPLYEQSLMGENQNQDSEYEKIRKEEGEEFFQNIPEENILKGLDESINKADEQNNQEFTQIQDLSFMNSSTNETNSTEPTFDSDDIDINDLYSFFFNNDLIEYKYKEALKSALELLEYNAKNNKEESFEHVETLFNVGKIFFETSQYKNSIEYYEKAEKIVDKKFAHMHFFAAGLKNRIAVGYNWLSEFETANNKIKEAQMHLEFLEGKEKIEKKAENFHTLAILLSKWEQDKKTEQKGIEYLKEALELYKELNDGSDLNRECYAIHNNIAGSYFYSKDFKKSSEHFLNSLRIGRAIYEGVRREVANILSHCGTVFAKLGELDKSLNYLNEAKEIYEILEIENQVSNAALTFNFCILEEERKDYKLALQLCEASFNILKTLVDDKNILFIEAVSKIKELSKKIEEQELSMVNSEINNKSSEESLSENSVLKLTDKENINNSVSIL